ncbi:MAG: DEAD/DEAH box helicase [Cyanobacteria bacterium]|nr:DEAD/DEAH box helicase [Cyanobacteriota bacterium]
MAVLHGSWQPHGQRLFLWGEVWRSVEGRSPGRWEIPEHPRAMDPAQLKDWLLELGKSGVLGDRALDNLKQWPVKQVALGLPTVPESPSPLHSGTPPEPEMAVALQPWWVPGLALDPEAALALLRSLPLAGEATESGSFVGSDLRFWSHVARWALDLQARSKALPTLAVAADGSPTAQWTALLESEGDRLRLSRLGRLMPAACRFYQRLERSPEAMAAAAKTKAGRGAVGARSRSTGSRPLTFTYEPPSLELPLSPRLLLSTFLAAAMDVQMRAIAGTLPLPGERRVAATKSRTAARGGLATATPLDPPVRDWLSGLGAKTATCQSPLAELMPLGKALHTWTASLQQADQPTADGPAAIGTNTFRVAFTLRPPDGPDSKTWTLAYGLQPLDDDATWVSAADIWRHPVAYLQIGDRVLARPQETLLKGLGLAARIFPAIEPSLNDAAPDGCPLTPVQAYQFIKVFAWRFQDSGLGVVLPASLREREGWASRLGLRVSAEVPANLGNNRLGLSGLLNFRWELSIGGQTLSQKAFQKLIAQSNLEELPLVQIGDEWVELRPADVRAAQDFFEKRQGQAALSLEDALRIGTGDTPTIDKLPVVEFESSGLLDEFMGVLQDNQSLAPLAAPDTFQGTLRPYQERGLSWLAFMERWGLGACLADDMGLGKTIQLIALLLHLKGTEALNGPVLLVCPTSVMGNWLREAKKFGPSLRVMIHHGDQRLKGKALARKAASLDLVITSYALVFRDEMTLQPVPWRGIVLDEAQNIKNSDSKQAQAVRRLVDPEEGTIAAPEDGEEAIARSRPFRIALTGTPVENRLSELWSILDFLNPGYLGAKNFFQRRFAVPIERYGDGASLRTLRSLVQPFILRRLKTDRTIVQDLPEKQEMTVYCGLSEKQMGLYQQLVERAFAAIAESQGIQRRGQILALLTRLKQVCNHPELLGDAVLEDLSSLNANASDSASGSAAEDLPDDGGETLAADPAAGKLSPQDSPKLERLCEMLEEVVAEGDRALLFTQFAQWGHLLQPYLQKILGQEVLFLYGGTPQPQREAMIDRFQNDPQGPKLLILSLKAGGVGLNLTRANHVFHYDRWWNPAVENQATDRAFRIGQTRNVQVHKFVCSGTLEEKIHDLIESKKALAEQVVGTGESWLTELDTDALRDLLLLDRTAAIG